MRSALPDAEFLEQHYSHEDVLVLEELRSKLDQMADPAVRNEWGRRALRQFWDDELEWIEHTHFIVNKSSQVQLFKVNYAQRQFYKDVIVRCRDEGRPIRAVILKGRQLGFSTFIQSWQYEQCDANPNRYSMTINYNEPMTEELFQKAKTIHDRLFFPRSLARARKDQLQFASPHSSIFHTETAGNLNAGRSLTLHHLHCSEVPMWPNGDEVVTSVHQSVPQLLSSSIFHESTAKGAQGAFYEYWNDAVAGRNNFVPFFAPWYWDPTYIQEFPSRDHERKFASTLSPQDLRYMEKYRLSIPQMAWRRWKIDNDLKGSERRFRQEYPADAEEAFLTTGSPAFDPEAVRDLTFQAAPPTWIGSITLAQT